MSRSPRPTCSASPRDFNEALQHFQAAEALAPNEPAMHDNLGDAQRALNNLSQARVEYTRAMR